eukprot:760501-Hanusia_phi.AAC.2
MQLTLSSGEKGTCRDSQTSSMIEPPLGAAPARKVEYGEQRTKARKQVRGRGGCATEGRRGEEEGREWGGRSSSRKEWGYGYGGGRSQMAGVQAVMGWGGGRSSVGSSWFMKGG